MKTKLAAALAALLTACTFHAASAQSAAFTYTGLPTSALTPGDSFTFTISLIFTAGGNVTDVAGLSYWLWQSNPGNAFPFSITNRDASGSVFSDLQSPTLTYPQPIDPINRRPDGNHDITDLGAITASGSFPSGTYLVASLTIAVSPSALPGNYSIGNTTPATPLVGGRFSEANSIAGKTVNIADSRFTVAVVPEAGTSSLLALGALLLIIPLVRRSAARF